MDQAQRGALIHSNWKCLKRLDRLRPRTVAFPFSEPGLANTVSA